MPLAPWIILFKTITGQLDAWNVIDLDIHIRKEILHIPPHDDLGVIRFQDLAVQICTGTARVL